MSLEPRETRTRNRSAMVVAIASMGVAVVALTLALGGFATAGPNPEKGEVALIATVTATIGFVPVAPFEGGEIDMYSDPDRVFTQEAGTTLLMVADATGPDLPEGCWVDFAFGADLDGDAIPDHGTGWSAFRLSAFSYEQGHVSVDGTFVNTLPPPAADRTVAVQAFWSPWCDGEYQEEDVPLTFEVTVLALS